MSSESKLKVAIVGCGQIADAHIAEARNAGAQVVGVCDKSVHMAEQAATRFGVPGVFTDAKQMLADLRPDVLHITTPPSSHLPLTRLAIEAGTHVYVEKPFMRDAAEAEEAVSLAESKGRLICVGNNYPFDPTFQRLLELVRSGALGDIVHVSTRMSYNLDGPFGSVSMKDPKHWVHGLPGGLVQNNISHPLSLALEFLPDEYPKILASGWRRRPQRFGDARDGFFDEVRASLIGAEVSSDICFSCAIRPVQLVASIHGTFAEASIHLDAGTLVTNIGASMRGPFRNMEWAGRFAAQGLAEFKRTTIDLAKARLHFFRAIRELFRRFYLATQGKEPMPVPMSESVRLTRILDQVLEQCKTAA